jgi:hypothetical protein
VVHAELLVVAGSRPGDGGLRSYGSRMPRPVAVKRPHDGRAKGDYFGRAGGDLRMGRGESLEHLVLRAPSFQRCRVDPSREHWIDGICLGEVCRGNESYRIMSVGTITKTARRRRSFWWSSSLQISRPTVEKESLNDARARGGRRLAVARRMPLVPPETECSHTASMRVPGRSG